MAKPKQITIDMDLPCRQCGQMGAGGRAQLCLECVGKAVAENITRGKERTVAKKGKGASKEVHGTCPHCGKSFDATVRRVVDEPGEPAVVHYEFDASKGSGGLLDRVETTTEGE